MPTPPLLCHSPTAGQPGLERQNIEVGLEGDKMEGCLWLKRLFSRLEPKPPVCKSSKWDSLVLAGTPIGCHDKRLQWVSQSVKIKFYEKTAWLVQNYLNIERRRLSRMKRKLSRWLKGEADPRVLTVDNNIFFAKLVFSPQGLIFNSTQAHKEGRGGSQGPDR